MKKQLLLFFITSLIFEFSIGQTTVFIGPDKDNSIYSEALNQSNSNGLGSLFSGVNGFGAPSRALIHFDIAGTLPVGAVVTDVTLSLDLHRRGTSSVGEDYSLHVVTLDWGEGTSVAGTVAGGGGAGAAAIAPDATWLDAMFGTSTWGTVGGDFMPAPSATTNVDTTLGNYDWTSAAMVTDVQSWFDSPSTNFGWILKMDNESVTDILGGSWGSKDQGVAPSLSVTYTDTLGLTDNELSTFTIYQNPAKDI